MTGSDHLTIMTDDASDPSSGQSQRQTTLGDSTTTDDSVFTDSTEDSFGITSSRGRKLRKGEKRYGRRIVRRDAHKENKTAGDFKSQDRNPVPDVAPSSRDVSRAILEGNPSHDRRLRQYIQGLERGRRKVEMDIFLHQRQFLLKQLFNKDLEVKYKRRAYRGVENDGEGSVDMNASPIKLSELPRLQRPETPRVATSHRVRFRRPEDTESCEFPAKKTRPLTQGAIAEHTLAQRLPEEGKAGHFPAISPHDQAKQEAGKEPVQDSYDQGECPQEVIPEESPTKQLLEPEERYVELDESDPSTFLIKKLLCCDVEDTAPRETDIELETIFSSSYDLTEQQNMEVRGTAMNQGSGVIAQPERSTRLRDLGSSETPQRRALSRKKSSLTDGANYQDIDLPYGTLGGCRMPRLVRKESVTAVVDPAETPATPPDRLPHLRRSAFQKSFSSPNLMKSHPVQIEARGFGSHPTILNAEPEPQPSMSRNKEQIIEKLALSLPVHLLTKAMEDKDQRILTLSWKDTHDKQKRLLAKTKKTLYGNHLRDPRFVKLQESLCTIETPSGDKQY